MLLLRVLSISLACSVRATTASSESSSSSSRSSSNHAGRAIGDVSKARHAGDAWKGSGLRMKIPPSVEGITVRTRSGAGLHRLGRKRPLFHWSGIRYSSANRQAVTAAQALTRRRSSSRRRSGVMSNMTASKPSAADKLRVLINGPETLTVPCCYDGLTARLVEDAGFPLTLMTGFGVSGAHGLPDTQLLSYAEMLSAATNICSALKDIPCIGDGDTGYGNAVNVKRTVKGYAQAGMAGIIIEDQIAPKRCGHTEGKGVVGREEAYTRIRAACDARDEGADILIVARTDALAGLGLEEALERCREFRRIGADVTFLDAPQSVEDMERYCKEVDGPKLAIMIEFGKTPILPPAVLGKMGYTMVGYPLSLLSTSIKAMKSALGRLKAEEPLDDLLESFDEVKRVVGFQDYTETAAQYEKKTDA